MDILFAGQSIHLQTDRCLNVRYKDAGCTRCVTTCPVRALDIATGQPVLDGEVCTRCGICLQTCPTDVFTQHNGAEAQLVQVVQPLPAQPVALVCALHPMPDQTVAPVSSVVQHRRCLAALGPVDLLELSAAGRRPLWLDDSVCQACPLHQAQPVIQENVAISQALLDAHGCHNIVNLTSQVASVPTQAPQRRTLIDGGQPKLSRRGLFTWLRATSAHRNDLLAPSALRTDRYATPRQRLPQAIPPSRSRLLAQLDHLPASPAARVPTQVIPFAAMRVDDGTCSACTLCARFCPTGALQFDREGDVFRLAFQAAHCIDCGICVAACPEAAIDDADELLLADLHAESARTLAAGILTRCVSCGASTAQHPQTDDPARCYACRQGAGVVTAQRDDAGLMADLLQRIS